VSLIARLKPILLEHRLRTGRSEGLVFGPDGARPFSYWTLVERAKRACAGATSPPSG
jgi:hypothetical protein